MCGGNLDKTTFMRPTACLLISLAFFNCQLIAQQKKTGHFLKKLDHVSIAFTDAHTALPFSSFTGLFYKEFHPGIEIGTGLNWENKNKHVWLQTLQLGYSYHQFVQRSLMIYTEVGYRYQLPLAFSATVRAGGGYLHSIQDAEVFVLDKDGEYVNAKKGRSHGMASLSISIGKKINRTGWNVFIDYQQRFQFDFIDAYVPALPVNAMKMGFSIPLQKNKSTQNLLQ
jgi:hypothetical protein